MNTIQINESLIPSSLNFLIVEDVKHVRDTIIEYLKEMGFVGKIKYTDNRDQALELASQEKFDFFILDWSLNEGTGHEILSKLRGNPEYHLTPMLMVTGHDSIEDMMSAMESGASAYLIKPWTWEELEVKLCEAWNFHLKSRYKITDFI